MDKNPPAKAGDMGSIPGLGRLHMLQSTSPVCHTTEPSRACKLQPLKPVHLEPTLCNKRSHCNEKPTLHNKEQPEFAATRFRHFLNWKMQWPFLSVYFFLPSFLFFSFSFKYIADGTLLFDITCSLHPVSPHLKLRRGYVICLSQQTEGEEV